MTKFQHYMSSIMVSCQFPFGGELNSLLVCLRNFKYNQEYMTNFSFFKIGGHSSFFGFLNTFVHIVMYSYYMLAAMGPKVQKYLWWKKYLTVMQMIQFVLVMIHSFQLFIWNECNYPIGFAYFIGAHALMFYFLFANFYKSTYKPDKKVHNDVVN
jgi:hypothetical protein